MWCIYRRGYYLDLKYHHWNNEIMPVVPTRMALGGKYSKKSATEEENSQWCSLGAKLKEKKNRGSNLQQQASCSLSCADTDSRPLLCHQHRGLSSQARWLRFSQLWGIPRGPTGQPPHPTLGAPHVFTWKAAHSALTVGEDSAARC